MSSKESYIKVILFVIIVAFVSSIVVSTVAVYLKPMQNRNIELDLKKNILRTAGFSKYSSSGRSDVSGMSDNEVEALYSKYITPVVIDLKKGLVNEALDYKTYDVDKASRTSGLYFSPAPNAARIMRVPNNIIIYLLSDGNGKLTNYIFPISGAGLWSRMSAFVSLELDLNTISSLVYYDQQETAGLGAEVENPKWLKIWKNKKIFDQDNNVIISVTKDSAIKSSEYGVDALSGATLTSNGVTETFKFWFGENGYLNYIVNLKSKNK